MKYRNLFFLLTLWEFVIWLAYNGHLLRTRIWILFDKQTIYEDWYLGSAFYNMESYLLVLAITSIFAMEYCLREDGVPVLLRYENRFAFCGRRWRTLAVVSLLYVLVHFSLGYSFSTLLFEQEFTYAEETAMFYVASAPLLFVFFFRVNVIYILLRDFFQKKIFATAGTLGIYITEYFFGYHIWETVWMPCKDIDMGMLAYRGGLWETEFIFAMIRQTGVTMLCMILSIRYFEHKDVMQLEP